MLLTLENLKNYYKDRKYDIQLTSVTKEVNTFAEEFPIEIAAQRYAEKRGLDPEEVKLMWAEKGKKTASAGTEGHNIIEKFLNKNELTSEELDNVFFKQFLKIYESRLYKVNFIAQEFKIWDYQMGLVGKIDSLIEINGQYYIIDYKTTDKMSTPDSEMSNRYKKMMLLELSNYIDSKFTHYSVQLNLYSIMLERAGFKDVKSAVIQIPTIDEPRIMSCIDLREPLRQHYKSRNKW